MNSKFDIIKVAKNSINIQGNSILKLSSFINKDFKNIVELINSIEGRVIVSGIGFDENSSTMCRFGVAIVTATVLNSTSLRCISPAAAAALDGSSFGAWSPTHDSFDDAMVSLEISPLRDII